MRSRCSSGTRTTCTPSWTRALPRTRSTPCRPVQPGRQPTASTCCTPGQRKTINLAQDFFPRGSRLRWARSSRTRERTRRCGWARVWNRGCGFSSGGWCLLIAKLVVNSQRIFGAF
ncbi:unnamed protein product [Ectocarpus sp. 6 AP-2014]